MWSGSTGAAAAASPAPFSVPFTAGDAFSYQFSEGIVFKAFTGTTTTALKYVETVALGPATRYAGSLAFPLHTTSTYATTSGVEKINNLEYVNWLPKGGRWYEYSYGTANAAVLAEPQNVFVYTTDGRTWGTPLIYDVLPHALATWTEPAALAESYDAYTQTSLGRANDLRYTLARAADGSFSETGTNVDVPYAHVVKANGTGTNQSGPAQGGTLWSFGLPTKSGKTYVIPATETFDGRMHTNGVPDWYPGGALPKLPLATAALANLGTHKAPAQCGKRAGTAATHLQYTLRQLDPVDGETVVQTNDYYFASGLGRICRLNAQIESFYDQKVKGNLTETITSNSSEVLLSAKLVNPAPLVLSVPALAFTKLGKAAELPFSASEKGYVDQFSVTSSNPGVASVAADTAQNGGAIEVTPVSGGKATIVVSDASQQTKSLTVSVTAATLTLRDVPSAARSVSISTQGAGLDQSVLDLGAASSSCAAASGGANTCTVTVGVLPGADVLNVESFSGPRGSGTVLTKTATAKTFKPATQNTYDVSNARYLAFDRFAGRGVGSLTAGAAGDPDVYFLYDPPASALAIAQLAPAGTYRSYAESPAGAASLAPGRAGSASIWFASKAALGALSAAGKATLYKTTVGACKAAYAPSSIALGPGGNPWFGEAGCGRYGIGTLVAGKVADYLFPLDASKKSEYSLSAATQRQLATGRDGNLWFVAVSCGLVQARCAGPPQYALGRITPKGALSFLPLKIPATCPAAYVASAGDGNVWFVACGAGKSTVLRVTPAGAVTAFGGLTTVANDVAEGPDGNLYVTGAGEIARLLTTGPQLGRVDFYYPPLGAPNLDSIGVGNDRLIYATDAGGFVDQIRPPSP
jgi:hypothetical protein